MSLSDEEISVIKGMLARGDHQHVVAACFLENPGRINEVKNCHESKYDGLELCIRARKIDPAPLDMLPPPNLRLSPYQAWKAQKALWTFRVTFENIKEKIDGFLLAINNAEGRIN